MKLLKAIYAAIAGTLALSAIPGTAATVNPCHASVDSVGCVACGYGAVCCLSIPQDTERAMKTAISGLIVDRLPNTVDYIKTHLCDYNGDGEVEMLAIATDEDSCKTYVCQYVGGKASEVAMIEGYDLNSEGWFASFPDISVVCLTTGFGGSGSIGTALLFDKNGVRIQKYMSGIVYDSNRDFCVTAEDFNGMKVDGDTMSEGHCWYPFYYYLDNTGELQEYAAQEISVEALEKYSGLQPMREAMAESGAKIFNVILRANGVINVNLREDFGDGYVNQFIEGRVIGNNIVWKNSYDEHSILWDGNISLHAKDHADAPFLLNRD